MDVLEHDAFDLIDHAASLNYQVLALTLHGRLYCPQELRDYAIAREILLIPGIEIYLDHHEILLLGVDQKDLARLKTLSDLVAFKKERGNDLLVIAPHPFYVLRQCIGSKLEKYAEAFDAVEFCHFYTSWCNPNVKATMVARRLGKPMIACSDTHRLKWMKDHYCLLDAKLTQKDVFTAIREGKIQNVSRPMGNLECLKKTYWLLINQLRLIARQRGWIQTRNRVAPRADGLDG